jgi:hypothetical protein
MVRYWTELVDAGMLMTALVFLMPLLSYDDSQEITSVVVSERQECN